MCSDYFVPYPPPGVGVPINAGASSRHGVGEEGAREKRKKTRNRVHRWWRPLCWKNWIAILSPPLPLPRIPLVPPFCTFTGGHHSPAVSTFHSSLLFRAPRSFRLLFPVRSLRICISIFSCFCYPPFFLSVSFQPRKFPALFFWYYLPIFPRFLSFRFSPLLGFRCEIISLSGVFPFPVDCRSSLVDSFVASGFLAIHIRVSVFVLRHSFSLDMQNPPRSTPFRFSFLFYPSRLPFSCAPVLHAQFPGSSFKIQLVARFSCST